MLLLTFAAGGCRRAEIRTYLAPKDVETDSKAPGLSYTEPPGWKKIPADGMNAVRLVFSTPQGEVSINITALGSMEGKEPMLVGMWRSVLGLPELSAEESAKALTPVEIAGEQGQAFEVTGSTEGKPMRIVTAFLHRGGQSWFFKMQGPPEGVESQKAAFTAFLKTVKF